MSSPSDNPAERAMITTVRVWFTWPFSGGAILLIGAFLDIELGISEGFGQTCFLVTFLAIGLIHVSLLLRSGLGSIVALGQKGLRSQGFIALIMVLFTALVWLPVFLIFLSAIGQSF